ncbi:hypothetical protein [Vibrio parahaemolyticus]|nr:hypothetical protein [Vibrio parahaemolyticus]
MHEENEEPRVLHYGQQNSGLTLREGMIFTIDQWQIKVFRR